MVLENAPLAKIAAYFLQQVEACLPQYQFAVMQLVQQTQTLSVLAAPSFSPVQLAAIDDIDINQQTTPCVVAAQSKQNVYIENPMASPQWRSFSSTLSPSNTNDFWSYPLVVGETCIGTLLVTGPSKQAATANADMPFKQVCDQLTKMFSYAESQQQKAREQWALENKAKRSETQVATLTTSCERLFNQLAKLEAAQLNHPVPPNLRLAATHLLSDIHLVLNASSTINGFLHSIAQQAIGALESKVVDEKLPQKLGNSANRAMTENKQLSVDLRARLTAFATMIDDIAQNPVRNINIAETLMGVLQSVASLPYPSVLCCITVDSSLTGTLPVGTFTQIFFELVSNTVRHAYTNNANGQLWISADTISRKNRTMMKIIVKDKGRGIPKSTIDKIMHPAQSEDFAAHRQGLTNCVRLVTQKLNGSIHYDDAQGGGNRFCIYLPIPN
ncbi:ATP-binding protein [Alteromonas sp. 14N.309.X.WAT.G.H12]